VDFARSPATRRKGEAKWKLARPTMIYGLAAWWTAELFPGVQISTAPGAPWTHWEQLYFPLLAPIEGAVGETVVVRLGSRSSSEAGTHLAWSALVLDRSGKARSRQALDLDKGHLP
jgi:protein arginine N-methyltransferase 1